MAQREIPSPITINGISIDWETAKKGLDKVLWQSAGNVRDYVSLLFKDGTFKDKTMKRKAFSGLPEAQEWNAKDVIPSQGINFMWDVTATHAWYANAVEYDLESKTFDPYDIIPRLPKELGLSMAVKRQRLAAKFFVDGFTNAGNTPDGKAFFALDHPNDPRLGGTQGNLVNGSIGVATFTNAINLLLGMTDPLGRPLNARPRRLFVHPTKVITVKQILGIGMEKEFATANDNEARNPFKDYDIAVVPFPWLGASCVDYWVLQASEHECYWSDAVKLQTRMTEGDNHSTRHEAWFSSTCWYDSWVGYVGGTGANG